MNFKKLILNILMYAVILLGVYYLYHPLNNHADNKPHSSFSFIYAQF